jgi:hypothetical protein
LYFADLTNACGLATSGLEVLGVDVPMSSAPDAEAGGPAEAHAADGDDEVLASPVSALDDDVSGTSQL